MIALGIITALCMIVMARNVWRVADGLLGPGETEGTEGTEGPGGHGGGGGSGGVPPVAPMDPLDQPGDGLSPHDLFLRRLLADSGAGPQPATTGPGGSLTP
jgi:hypothetical protein